MVETDKARRRSAWQVVASVLAIVAIALALTDEILALAWPRLAILSGGLGVASIAAWLALRGVAVAGGPTAATSRAAPLDEVTPAAGGPQERGEGQRIGRYTLEERLAVGGMGEIWRASHDTLLRPAALKVIRPQPGKKTPSRERLERFRREAMVTSGLTSPHTVDLFDFGVEGTTLYLAMELLEGLSLRELVEQHGPLPEARVTYLIRQACHSLIEAHEQGVVHRDIKPENILITRAGRDHDFVKVIDFGLVKQLARGSSKGTMNGEEQAPGRELTAMHARLGTPGYMAPEQFGGDGIDQRADIYALACVAYYALTGTPVFEGTEDGQLMFAHMAVDPESPSERLKHPVHRGLEAVLMRCLAKNPLDRPLTMEALDRELETLSFDEPWTAAHARAWWASVAHTSARARRISGHLPAMASDTRT